MVERLKELGKKILEWWTKFDVKKRAAIISAVAVVVITFVILGFVLNRTTMVDLMVCESTSEAAEIKELLDSAGIENKVSDDGLRIQVDEDSISSANLELGANGYPTADYDLDTVFSGGFSSTESDKQKKWNAYLESKMASDLASMDVIEEAKVSLSVPENNGTIYSQDKEASVSVSLKLKNDIDESVAMGLAKFIATAVGNKTTSNITIMDYSANLLFSGEEEDSTGISAATMMTQLSKSTEQMKKAVKEIFLAEGYDLVTVAPQLKLDTSKVSETSTEYSAPDGRDEGMLSSKEWYIANSTNGTDGTPGTDSNDDATYMVETGGESTSEVEEGNEQYLPNKKETVTERSAGTIVPEESSISVVLTNYVYYDEDELEAQGALDGITFDEFVAQNRGRNQLEITDDMLNLVAGATGISTDRITITAYEEPFFQPSTEAGIPWSMILTIIVLVLIVLLLAFVVFRSTRPVVVEEFEPETSVEDLIASTAANETLDDIEFEEKSEARKLIDKFVEENPEAVAQLLRNWLNEEGWD